MRAPVRMVCGDCLRSVELTPDEAGRLPALCPICGGTIDTRLSAMETPTSHFTLPIPRDEAGAAADNRWSETWTKGTLGTIGRFQLRELLGDGGFGEVYQAYDPRLDRDVALKVLKQLEPGERVMQRFFREARAAARLSHPNIVGVLDAGCDGGRAWIAYDYVDGRTLSRLLDSQKMDDLTAVRIARALADALDHSHRAGVYHRDLKPANVIVDADGNPHLIDFGLARRADLDSDLTRDGAILGTPAYMSPEQAGGQSRLADERSDVYSLGVMLFELLCGRRPADSPSAAFPWHNVTPKTVTPAPHLPSRAINEDVPVALERICMKALATSPEDRYVDAAAFRHELDRWLRSQEGNTRLSGALANVLMGIAGSLLLIVTIQTIFASSRAPTSQPAALVSSPIEGPEEPSGGRRLVVPRVDPAYATFGPVFSPKRSPKYHTEMCSDLRNSSASNLRKYATAADAEREGLTPCNQFATQAAKAAKAQEADASP